MTSRPLSHAKLESQFFNPIYNILPLDVLIVDFFSDLSLMLPNIQLPFMEAECHWCLQSFWGVILGRYITFVVFQLNKLQVHFFSLVESANVMPTNINMLALLSHPLILNQKITPVLSSSIKIPSNSMCRVSFKKCS
jgi:hypothetical protein